MTNTTITCYLIHTEYPCDVFPISGQMENLPYGVSNSDDALFSFFSWISFINNSFIKWKFFSKTNMMEYFVI